MDGVSGIAETTVSTSAPATSEAHHVQTDAGVPSLLVAADLRDGGLHVAPRGLRSPDPFCHEGTRSIRSTALSLGRALLRLALAATPLPAAPALAQTAPVISPPNTQTPAAPSVNVDKRLIDEGQTHQLRVFGRVGAPCSSTARRHLPAPESTRPSG